MNDLDRSILATLAYYGSFGWPLTLVELYARLIPQLRLGGRATAVTLDDITERLEVLGKIGTVTARGGLYTLGAFDIADRVHMEKEQAQKWRHLRRWAWWLQAVPYIHALFASGSLALGNVEADSDWDVMVVARSGRLYLARLGLLAAASLMGRLRVKTDRDAADKFCFNHYVTTDGLALRHHSLYTAHGLATLVPIMDTSRTLERLWQANDWMGQYVPLPTSAEFVRRRVTPSRFLMTVQRTLEVILDATLGDTLERGVRRWMQRRIAATPATHEHGGRVSADDQELEFHPRSFEAVALVRYNATLERLGLGRFAESDSGLTR